MKIRGRHHLMKLQHLQNTVAFAKSTPTRELHMAFNIPYEFITWLCTQQAEENAPTKYKRLKLGDGQACNFRASNVPF